MREKILVTKVCEECGGKGWHFFPNEILRRPAQVCRKCHGLGIARYKDFLYFFKRAKKFPEKVVVKSTYPLVKKFVNAKRERWNEIQRKYRHSEKYRTKFYKYLKERRAMKKLGIKRKLPKRIHKIKYQMCVVCGVNPKKKWGRKGLCVYCIVREMKANTFKPTPVNPQDVLKLRNDQKLTFSEIGRCLAVSRQRAQQIYQRYHLTTIA